MNPSEKNAPARRRFLNTAAAAGLAGVGLAACSEKPATATAAKAPAPAQPNPGEHAPAIHLKPGELDTYYGFWSGGHTGDLRVLGLPSGREITRIPCFVPDALVGWGITNESKKIMGQKADGSLKYTVGDSHHVHASYKDGNYDGRYAWINDKINARIARIRLDYFVCDKITELPNVQGFHGIFPDKRDPVDPAVNYTTRVFCGAEFHIPLSLADIDKPEKYRSLFSCVDAETMEVRWQALIDGNCDLVATSYDGKLAATNQYNTEGGAKYEDMMSSERDACLFFNIARIEAAVKAGKFKTVGDSKVPVVDGTRESNKDPKTALTAYVSVPKNPHGVNASPDGKYFVCAGELSPTATVIELAKVLDWFEGKLEKADKAIVAEVELGLGPLHTAFDGRGNAYTTLFLDSQVVKWNVDAAIKFAAGDKNSKYVVDRVDVQYQPGHLNASQSETRAADGKWLAVGCKFSKDRFLPAGPLHPENEQLIDISGEKMVLLAAPLLERVGLAHAAARPVREYSKGMRQRLGFAQALLGRPSVLFLDEPTTGLDPAAIRDFYATLASLREQGTTVVVTSHILAELQERVDRLALLAAGRVRAAGSVQALRERIALPLRVSLRAHAGAVPALREALAPLPLSAASWRGDELQAQLPRSAKMPLLAAIAALPGAADDVQVHEPSLEDVYFGLAA